MDILKLVRILKYVIILSFIISCKDSRHYSYYTFHKININGWDINKANINFASISIFEKNTNFKNLEKTDSLFHIKKHVNSIDSTNIKNHFIEIYFKNIDSFPLNKDYILVINKRDIYKISDIDTITIIRGTGGLAKYVEYNHINNLKVNNKTYNMKSFAVPYNAKKIKL